MIHIYDKKGFTKLFSHDGDSFKGLDISNAELAEANMIQMDLREANLSHADLSNADLRMANLSGANLSHAILVGTDLDGAITDNCDMTAAIFAAPTSPADENGDVAVSIDSIGKRSR